MVRKGILALIIFTLLVAGGVSFYIANLPPTAITSPLQVTVTPTSPVMPTETVLDAEKVTISTLLKQFYQAYSSCMQNPPKEAAGKVSTYCQANNPYSSAEFTKNLVSGGAARRGIDPVTCSQNPVSNIMPDSVDFESPERALVTIALQYGGGFAQKVPVVVIKDSGAWRVDTITCPRS